MSLELICLIFFAVLERYTEKLNQQTGSADDDLGLIHVGIQTEHSQKVDVTVHNPVTAGVSASEQTVDSKIRMNITDDRGQVTVTTAEITHSASKGEGSEAEVVLHVRTTYTNPPEDGNVEIDKQLKVGDEKEMPPNSNFEGLKESGKIPFGESNRQDQEKQDSSDKDSSRSSSHAKHSRTASLPAKTDSLKSKESVKSNTGKHSLRRSDRSRKHSRNKDFRSGETDSQAVALGLVNPDQGPALPKNSNEKTSDDQEENVDEALYQSGCFLKLFSKKLNTLQNQLGKEKEKISLTRSLSEPIDHANCPDLVSCIIASELKNRENKEDAKEQDRDTLPVQQAEGIVAKETCSTSF